MDYFLALVRRPGDSKFIDISKLSIAQGYNPKSLAELDSFTMHFTQEELRNAIREDNVVEESFLNGNFVIQDREKQHHFEVIDKDFLGDFQLITYFKEHLNNKGIMNNISYKLSTLGTDSNIMAEFKKAKDLQDTHLIANIITNIDYLTQRVFIVYLLHLYQKEQLVKDKKKERTRDKAA